MAQDVTSTDPRVGTTLAERYRIDALLGEGGMGKVYAAEHVLMRKRLAVKVLHPELTKVPDVVARFEREAMAAANIDHPNVAAATDFGKLPDGAVFLVLEYVEGRNLRDEIAKGPLGVERSVRIARQIASALANAHALEIVHRDLKPENVMLVEKGGEADFVKVLDFGIAKVPMGDSQALAGKPITKVGMVFGTPEYMSPEQALGQTVDGRADLYGLGVIFYEMLAGVRPYSSSAQVGILGQQLSKPIPSFAERAPGITVPPAVEHVVRTLLQRDLADRFQKAEDVVAALDVLLGLPLQSASRLFTQMGGSVPAPLAPPSTPDLLGGLQPLPPFRTGAPVLAAPTHGDLASGAEPLPSFPLDASAEFALAAAQAGAPPRAVVASESWPAAAKNGADASSDLTIAVPIRAPTPIAAATVAATASNADAAVALVGAPAAPKAALPQQLDAMLSWVDQRRAKLPGRLKGVPTPALLAGAGVVALAALTALIVLVSLPFRADRDGDVVAEAPASSERSAVPSAQQVVPGPELEGARRAGLAGLAALAAKHPGHAGVQRELALALHAEKKHAEAVAAVAKAIELDPELAGDAELSKLLTETAQTEDTLDATFDLLEGKLGARGAEVAYDLALSKEAPPTTKERAKKYVLSEPFAAAASSSLAIAAKLFAAKLPSEVAALLDEAEQKGDQRVLDRLRALETKQVCYKVRRKGRCVKSGPFLDAKTLQDVRTTAAVLEKRIGAAP